MPWAFLPAGSGGLRFELFFAGSVLTSVAGYSLREMKVAVVSSFHPEAI